jgi:hypothetical protein
MKRSRTTLEPVGGSGETPWGLPHKQRREAHRQQFDGVNVSGEGRQKGGCRHDCQPGVAAPRSCFAATKTCSKFFASRKEITAV